MHVGSSLSYVALCVCVCVLYNIAYLINDFYDKITRRINHRNEITIEGLLLPLRQGDGALREECGCVAVGVCVRVWGTVDAQVEFVVAFLVGFEGALYICVCVCMYVCMYVFKCEEAEADLLK